MVVEQYKIGKKPEMLRENILVDCLTDKGSSLVNEDEFLLGTNIFGVFDGATSLKKYFDEDGNTGGNLAARIVKGEFQKNNTSLVEMAKRANLGIREKMEKNRIDTTDKLNLFSTTAAVVRINFREGTFDWLQLGDSVIVIIYEDNSHKLLVTDYDHDEETLCLWKELNDRDDKNKFKLFEESKLKTRMGMNESGGYGIFNGDERMVDYLKFGVESLDGIKNIVCITDGMFIPNPYPETNDDFDIWVDIFSEGGLDLVKEKIRKIESDDPKYVDYPRFKVHDDMTGVVLTFPLSSTL